ncbi:MAG: transporter substrate-binding domain-containing protein [Pararhizobium sp.]
MVSKLNASAPVRFLGFVVFLIFALVVPLSAETVLAQEKPIIPNYFDPKERIALPDLSDYGRIRFLTVTDFPPFSFIDQTGRLSGFNVDLARGICEELKVVDKCQIQALPWNELEKALSAGDGEAIVAGVAITAEARKTLSFTRAYLQFPARFVRNTSVSLGGRTADALAARRVGVVKGSAHQAMLKAFFPRIEAVPFDSRSAMLDALKARKVDAVFGDGLQLSFWLSSKTAAGCCAFFDGPYLSRHFLGEGLAIAARRKDEALTEAFDHALLAMSRDGRFAEIYLRYFPNGMY